MANLGTFMINTNGDFATLASKTGLTFTEGTTYSIQVQNIAWLREGTIGEGFLINSDKPIEYLAKSDTLYIKTSFIPCSVNIAS